MKVLVTGSSGHLGEALVRQLTALKHDVVSVDILPSPYTSHIGSITDEALMTQCIQGVETVLHAATLHKPHVATHSKQDFIDTNITGTLVLLEAALAAKVQSFIYTSTTSVFGDALTPAEGLPTAWINEAVTPIPKNIYGVTKFAAENLCQLFYRNHQLPCLILRTSRFFLEENDNPKMRSLYADTNIKLNEFLYRRVDIQDVVSAHLLAMKQAAQIGFERFIISASTPFQQSDIYDLAQNAPAVLKRYFPSYNRLYQQKGWQMFPALDRVYDNTHAKNTLGWAPEYTFANCLERLESGKPLMSPLADEIGAKGYHQQRFSDGPYPVEVS